MDRSSLFSKLEHKNCISKVSSKNSSWDNLGNDYYTNNINNGGEYDHNLVGAAAAAGGLFSWPPTCYTCSFCKREFRSAQALGGHMNVHRRDKARLMRPHESPPRNADDQNPNLIFSSRNPNSSPSFTKFPHFASTLPQVLAPYDHIQTKDDDEDDEAVQIFQNFRPMITRDFMKLKDAKELSGDVGEFDRFVCEEIVKKRSEFVQLDLEIGLINSHQSDEEDLDLELRLGCN